ncbi:hypothetical protein [Micromonospora sp. CPCC 206061]|uniref:hypothetical protein n=1 Tax=Micromonospora sp. CPCC 206061 TaxID=3122410 RepID=UPI002FF087A2
MYRRGSYTFLGLDIEGFERDDRGECLQIGLRASLYDALLSTLEKAAVEPVDLLDRGDGVLAILPASVDAKVMLTAVIPRLVESLNAHNATASGPAIMRLRVVIHVGMAVQDGRGYIGRDVRLVFRLLDSDTLRRRLARSSDSVVLAVTREIWKEIDSPQLKGLQHLPEFGSLTFETKETREQAWVAGMGRAVPV